MTYVHLNSQDYYGICFEVKYDLGYKNPVWEIIDDKLFLLMGLDFEITDFRETYGANWNNVDSVIRQNLSEKFRYRNQYTSEQNVIDRVCVDAECTEDELKLYVDGDISGSKVEKYLIDKIGAAIHDFMQSTADFHIVPKLYPKIKDRTKIPALFLYIDLTGNLLVDFLDDHNYGDAINSTKCRKQISAEQFVKSSYPRTCLNYIPLNNWLEGVIKRPDLLGYEVSLTFY